MLINGYKKAVFYFQACFSLISFFLWRCCLLAARIFRVRRKKAINQLLIDVSVILKHDAHTGIQRVVKSITSELLDDDISSYEIKLIYATKKKVYRYASNFMTLHSQNLGCGDVGSIVKISSGDIFLGLDLAANIIPSRCKEIAFWKKQGVKIYFLVYDLLPIQHPEWFNRQLVINFEAWLHVIGKVSDGLICISNVVKRDVENWLQGSMPFAKTTLHVIPLGGCINHAPIATSTQFSSEDELLLLKLRQVFNVLVVGTFEPRKGHAALVNMFELLWQRGSEVVLVLVGKQGWGVDDFESYLDQHVEKGHKLYRLSHVTDDLLGELYKVSDGVILPSYAEGFGLPLVEALSYNKPVFVRDIPVFREVGRDAVSYFSKNTIVENSYELEAWLNLLQGAEIKKISNVGVSWKDSALALSHILGL